MPSTQSSLSTEKGNAELVNKQPPPSMTMSTDPNAPQKRALRLRGGCLVRYPSAVPISSTYTFFRNVTCPVGAAI
jgi:hypothetical protein